MTLDLEQASKVLDRGKTLSSNKNKKKVYEPMGIQELKGNRSSFRRLSASNAREKSYASTGRRASLGARVTKALDTTEMNSFSYRDDDEKAQEHNLEIQPAAAHAETAGCVIHPQNSHKITWDLLVAVFILYSVICIPYRIGFGQEATGAWYIFDWCVDGIFTIDLFLSFMTAYWLADTLIVDPKMIAWHYLRTWFIIDFLSILPIDLLVTAFAAEEDETADYGVEDADSGAQLRSLKLVKILRLIRLLKLVRLLKLKKMGSSLEGVLTINPALQRLLSLLLKIVFISHLLSCFWFFISTVDEESTNNWVAYHGLAGNSTTIETKYLSSFYWCIATMMAVGYGDLYAVNDYERMYSILVQVTGATLFGFIIANISAFLETYDPRASAYRTRIDRLKQYMRDRQLPRNLQKRVKRYYDYLLTKESIFDDSNILAQLPAHLTETITLQVNAEKIRTINFLRGENSSFIAYIMARAHVMLALSGEVVCEQDSVGMDFYMICNGKVEAIILEYGLSEKCSHAYLNRRGSDSKIFCASDLRSANDKNAEATKSGPCDDTETADGQRQPPTPNTASSAETPLEGQTPIGNRKMVKRASSLRSEGFGNNKEPVVCGLYTKGSHFGEVGMIRGIPHNVTFRANRTCDMLSLNKEVLDYAVYMFPRSALRFHKQCDSHAALLKASLESETEYFHETNRYIKSKVTVDGGGHKSARAIEKQLGRMVLSATIAHDELGRFRTEAQRESTRRVVKEQGSVSDASGALLANQKYTFVKVHRKSVIDGFADQFGPDVLSAGLEKVGRITTAANRKSSAWMMKNHLFSPKSSGGTSKVVPTDTDEPGGEVMKGEGGGRKSQNPLHLKTESHILSSTSTPSSPTGRTSAHNSSSSSVDNAAGRKRRHSSTVTNARENIALAPGKRATTLSSLDRAPKPDSPKSSQQKAAALDRAYTMSEVTYKDGTKLQELEMDIHDILHEYWIIVPSLPLKVKWDLLVAVFIIYSVIIVPYRIGFSQPATGALGIFDFLVDAIFGLDILIAFRTAFENSEDDVLVLHPRLIARHYLTHWFPIDLISTVPIDLIVITFAAGANQEALRSFKLIKVARLLKLARVFKLKKVLANLDGELIEFSSGVFKLGSLFIKISFVAHIFACMFYFVSTLSDEEQWYVKLGLSNVAEEDAGSKYLASLYWSFTTATTVGYGDISPTTNHERLYAIFIMIMGATIFGYVVGSIANLISQLDLAEALYKSKMLDLSSFLAEQGVPKSLRKECKSCYSYALSLSSVFDEKALLSALSPTLRHEITIFVHSQAVEEIPIFRHKTSTFIADIIRRMNPQLALPNTFIVRKGSIASQIYFIVAGDVQVYVGDWPRPDRGGKIVFDETRLMRMSAGTFFGHKAVLTGKKQQITARASSLTQLYILSKSSIGEIVDQTPPLALQLQSALRKAIRKQAREFPAFGDQPPASAASKGSWGIVKERFGDILNLSPQRLKDASRGINTTTKLETLIEQLTSSEGGSPKSPGKSKFAALTNLSKLESKQAL